MPDVFDVLSEDHSEVKQMLAQLTRERPGRQAGREKLAERKQTAARLITEESRHEAAEEMVFWPAVREKLPDGDKLADTATGQEEEAKKVLAKLDKLEAGSKEFEELIAAFAKDGQEHITYEETEVWPHMRKALSKREATEMGKKMLEAKKTAPGKPAPGQVPRQRGRSRGKADTAGKTRTELYERARELGIQGRSSMNKEELARHVSQGH